MKKKARFLLIFIQKSNLILLLIEMNYTSIMATKFATLSKKSSLKFKEKCLKFLLKWTNYSTLAIWRQCPDIIFAWKRPNKTLWSKFKNLVLKISLSWWSTSALPVPSIDLIISNFKYGSVSCYNRFSWAFQGLKYFLFINMENQNFELL